MRSLFSLVSRSPATMHNSLCWKFLICHLWAQFLIIATRKSHFTVLCFTVSAGQTIVFVDNTNLICNVIPTVSFTAHVKYVAEPPSSSAISEVSGLRLSTDSWPRIFMHCENGSILCGRFLTLDDLAPSTELCWPCSSSSSYSFNAVVKRNHTYKINRWYQQHTVSLQ